MRLSVRLAALAPLPAAVLASELENESDDSPKAVSPFTLINAHEKDVEAMDIT